MVGQDSLQAPTVIVNLLAVQEQISFLWYKYCYRRTLIRQNVIAPLKSISQYIAVAENSFTSLEQTEWCFPGTQTEYFFIVSTTGVPIGVIVWICERFRILGYQIDWCTRVHTVLIPNGQYKECKV